MKMMKKYDLTEWELQQVANLCKQEQGSVTGAKAEASLMCNLLETHSNYQKKYGDDLISFLKYSGWFSRASYWMDNGSADKKYVDAVRDVVCNGNRVFPLGIDEHDCISDITWISTGSRLDRSAYIPNKTVIRNKYGSEYTFFCFPCEGADPFGYTANNKKYMGESPMVTVLSVLSLARSWMGRNEADGSHREIINIYNSHTPLARGYKVQYTDAWCATFVSAVFIKLGVYDFLECGCPEMIEKLKSLGYWIGRTADVKAGDIVFYDWDGDGIADHVGIADNLTNGTLCVDEGNYQDSVKQRYISVQDVHICGIARPDYAVDNVSTEAEKTYSVTIVKVWKGCPDSPSVLLLQEILMSRGYYKGKLDKSFGDLTETALIAYQEDRIKAGAKIGGSDGRPDGICGNGTWTDLLGIKVCY